MTLLIAIKHNQTGHDFSIKQKKMIEIDYNAMRKLANRIHIILYCYGNGNVVGLVPCARSVLFFFTFLPRLIDFFFSQVM